MSVAHSLCCPASESQFSLTFCLQYDVSLPLENYYKVVECLKERLAGKANMVVGYGHIGDCNIHVNVTTDGFSREVLDLIEPFIFDYAGVYN